MIPTKNRPRAGDVAARRPPALRPGVGGLRGGSLRPDRLPGPQGRVLHGRAARGRGRGDERAAGRHVRAERARARAGAAAGWLLDAADPGRGAMGAGPGRDPVRGP